MVRTEASLHSVTMQTTPLLLETRSIGITLRPLVLPLPHNLIWFTMIQSCGEVEAQTINNSGNTNATGLQVGRTGTTGSITGEIDELRFSALIRDEDWILTEFNNHTAPAIFYAHNLSRKLSGPNGD